MCACCGSRAVGEGEGAEWDEDHARNWSGDRTRDQLTRIVAAYRRDLPQVCRQPAVMWFFAGLLAGEWRGMGETLDALVDACRARPGRGGTSASRSRCGGDCWTQVLATRSGRRGTPTRRWRCSNGPVTR